MSTETEPIQRAINRATELLAEHEYTPLENARWCVCRNGQWASRYFSGSNCGDNETFLVTIGLIDGRMIVEVLRNWEYFDESL